MREGVGTMGDEQGGVGERGIEMRWYSCTWIFATQYWGGGMEMATDLQLFEHPRDSHLYERPLRRFRC